MDVKAELWSAGHTCSTANTFVYCYIVFIMTYFVIVEFVFHFCQTVFTTSVFVLTSDMLLIETCSTLGCKILRMKCTFQLQTTGLCSVSDYTNHRCSVGLFACIVLALGRPEPRI